MSRSQTSTSTIACEATPFKIGDWTVLRLPNDASEQLPSRGMAMIEGTIDGKAFRTPLEPDGKWSHWFRVDNIFSKTSGIRAGKTTKLEFELIKIWPRPEIPEDLRKALVKAPEARLLWGKITPKAQWEWIRWIRSTKQAETHERRIRVACSKLGSGIRRPCCFNSNVCTEPYVSHNWTLLEPVKQPNS